MILDGVVPRWVQGLVSSMAKHYQGKEGVLAGILLWDLMESLALTMRLLSTAQ